MKEEFEEIESKEEFLDYQELLVVGEGISIDYRGDYSGELKVGKDEMYFLLSKDYRKIYSESFDKPSNISTAEDLSEMIDLNKLAKEITFRLNKKLSEEDILEGYNEEEKEELIPYTEEEIFD